MLKKLNCLLATLIICCLSGNTNAQTTSKVIFYDTVTKNKVNVKRVAQTLSTYDAVLFGEYHDQKALHIAEKNLLEQLYNSKKGSLILSMEMFERDVQPLVNEYLSDTITEEAFLKQARPWPNYRESYRPLVEFAKKHSLPIIAANIPRYLAARYAKTGMLSDLNDTEKSYLPGQHSFPDGAYKERFFTTLGSANSMNIPQQRLLPMYKAQCLKDDTMAESIFHAWKNTPQRLIFHVQGEFHGSYNLGTAEKLQKLSPTLQIAVLTPLDRRDFENGTDYSNHGRYLVLFDRQ